MGLFEHLIAGAAHLILIVMDIFAVFMLARSANLIWSLSWLGTMDRVGRPMTNWLLDIMRHIGLRIWRRKLSERQQIAFALLALLVIRICVSAIFHG